jgi:16S rRNA (adenine1518-N6/adenine1519-N6)-dimethyltransferase
MLQRELAARLVAPPGTKSYGVPTVLLGQHARIRRLFGVGRGAFTPVPRVDSEVVSLELLAEPRAQAPEALLREVVHLAFQRRRKMLRRALDPRFPRRVLEEAFARSGVDGDRRGEVLSLEEFAALARALEAAEAVEAPP